MYFVAAGVRPSRKHTRDGVDLRQSFATAAIGPAVLQLLLDTLLKNCGIVDGVEHSLLGSCVMLHPSHRSTCAIGCLVTKLRSRTRDIPTAVDTAIV